MPKTQIERIASLEVEVAFLRDEIQDANRKLDDLLALRNKGAGVFWLMTVLFGAGFATLLTYLKGHW